MKMSLFQQNDQKQGYQFWGPQYQLFEEIGLLCLTADWFYQTSQR